MRDYEGWPADACAALDWPAIPISVQAATGNRLLLSGRMLLRGWSLQNGNAGAQVVQLLDGTDSTGLVVAYGSLPAGANFAGPSADAGILLTVGAFLVVAAGPLNGAVYVTPLSGVRGEFGPAHHRR